MKGPFEFQMAEYQQRILAAGTRQQIIDWLCWKDPNGWYSDEDSIAKDRPTLTLEGARMKMAEQLSR